MESDAIDRRSEFAAEVKARTGIDEAMIRRLVHGFYSRIRIDPVLGPIFAARIKEWDPHLARMCAFWSSVVLMTGRYHGRPMQKHALLPVSGAHFDRWLRLFADTAREMCPPAGGGAFHRPRAHDWGKPGARHCDASRPVSGKRRTLAADQSRLERHMIPDEDGEFASPPCFMHEIDPAFGMPVDRQQARDVARWRKVQRERLIAARLALSAEERTQHAQRIARDLDGIVTLTSSTIVSVYWPFRGEPDLRPWMTAASRKRGRVALPVVVGKGQALQFRTWHPAARLERGVWNIPFPADGPVVVPTVVIAPLVGFDARRLSARLWRRLL